MVFFLIVIKCFTFKCFSFNNFESILYIKFEEQSSHFFEKELPILLVIWLLYGCFIVFVCLSLWCWGLDVDLIVSVPEFSHLLYMPSSLISQWWVRLLRWCSVNKITWGTDTIRSTLTVPTFIGIPAGTQRWNNVAGMLMLDVTSLYASFLWFYLQWSLALADSVWGTRHARGLKLGSSQ